MFEINKMWPNTWKLLLHIFFTSIIILTLKNNEYCSDNMNADLFFHSKQVELIFLCVPSNDFRNQFEKV